MKASVIFAALAASVASAQVVSNCTLTSTLPATYTITDMTISTYCPVCDEAKTNGAVYTTVYETTLIAVCSTGLSSAVYTVTNTATGTTAIATTAIPPGFTTTATVCNACVGSPTLTITVPVAAVQTSATGVGSSATAAATTTATAATTAGSTATGSGAAQYTGAASNLEVSVLAGIGSIVFGILML